MLVVGYIRPEANFESLDALIKRIHKDADVTRRCLLSAQLASTREHPFLLPGGQAVQGKSSHAAYNS